MDNCKKFQDLILTDYIDGEFDQSAKAELDAHLAECADCRRLAQEVKRDSVAPFESLEREAVPGDLWASIKERISSERPSPSSEFIGRLTRALSPQWAPAFVLTTLIVIGVLFYNQRIEQRQVKEGGEEEYLAYVLSETDVSLSADDEGLGTPIEQYFL